MNQVVPWRGLLIGVALAGWMGATCGLGAVAQASATRPIARITSPVDESQLTTLKGNTSSIAQAAFDRGAAPVSMPANRLILVLKRSQQQQADLETYLEAVQDPKSPSFHKFLTPEQFGQLYGVSDADLATVETWLEGHGLKVDRVEKGRMALEISGTVGQVQTAFHTAIHSFAVKGQQYWANTGDPAIPTALTPVVAGVSSLNSMKPVANNHRGPSGVFDARTQTIRPSYTVPVTGGYVIYLGPADAATVYDTPTSLNPKLSGTAYDGTGVTIGIAGDSNVNLTQIANYRSTFGLAAKAAQVVVDGADPGTNGDEIEAYLDMEVATGIAPNANIILYTAANTTYEGGVFLAIQRALDDNQATILNVSFSECETGLGSSGNLYVDQLWQQAAAQGIAVTVASGDSGSAGCDDPHTEADATKGLAVNGLGSTPYNISVGGTDFDVLVTNFTAYVDTSNTLPNHRSALGYIPERPWNNSTYPNVTISGNISLSHYSGFTDNIVAAGGGVSSVYSTPAFQSGFGSTAGRNLPDVAFLAGNGFYGAVWGLCTDLDTNSSGGSITDCAPPATGNNFNLTGVGGTSAAAPAFAGMLALAQQKAGARLGQADYVLYRLARSSYGTVFYDVVSGNNSVSCVNGTPNCAFNSSGYSFLSGYDTKAGYDNASGLGSVNVTQMLNAWASAGLTATTSSLKLNGGTGALTITHGQSVTVTGTVTGSGGTPTGLMGLVDDLSPANYPGQEAITDFTLSSGAISGTTTYLPGGTYNVSAHYSGDANFAQSDSNAIPVTVGAEASTTSLTVAGYYDPSTGSQLSSGNYGDIIALDAQPYGNSSSLANPDGAATGTITFKDGTATLGTSQLSSVGVAELLTTVIPGGSNSLTAVFPGDASFDASTSSAVGLTVAPGVTSMGTPTATPTNPAVGASVSFGITLATHSAGAAPTGTVTFKDGTATLGTVNLAGTAGSFSQTSTVLAAGTASYSTTSLTSGTHSVTAVYSGDGNYATSTSTAMTVTVGSGGGSGSYALTGTAVTISTPGATTGNTSTITVTPSGGFTGNVALTAAITSSPTGALYAPTLSFGTTTPVTISGTTAVTATMTVSTTAKTSAAVRMPERPGAGWMAGSAALACLLLFGIPGGERRRRWRQMLGMVMLAAA
ncbi:MAG TPA: Ig-like domain repeat protein, partial [Terracidiphilus sp.]|nr:Ig-like domain repeat protein [Terracidiphilus sp.]